MAVGGLTAAGKVADFSRLDALPAHAARAVQLDIQLGYGSNFQ
jgi:hypothetical protein